MKTTQFIKGNVFIIPNSLTKVDEFFLESVKSDINYVMQANNIPLEQRKDEQLVQVWFYTPGNDESNWSAHRIDGYDELKGWKPCSEFLPVSLFAGKDDGDVVTVDLPISKYDEEQDIISRTSIKVQLKLDQLNTRYRRFGSFAEVLKQLGANV